MQEVSDVRFIIIGGVIEMQPFSEKRESRESNDTSFEFFNAVRGGDDIVSGLKAQMQNERS